MGKIILCTWDGEKNGEKNVVRTYIKQEPESCSSVKTEMVFSDDAKRRILVHTSTTGKLFSDHFKAAAKRQNKSKLARDLNVFAKVQTKLLTVHTLF